MVFPTNYLRHTLLFSLAGGEVANCSIAWKPTTGDFTTLSDAKADVLAGKALAMWTTIKPYYSSPVTFNGSRIALLDPSGVTQATKERSITAVPGTGGGNTLPQEVAIVASLLSATYSRRGRGRIYLPSVGTNNVLSSGRFDSSARAIFSGAVATYCAPDTTEAITASIASKAASTLYPITTVKVGDVFDVQRRRRDALVEVYSTNSV